MCYLLDEVMYWELVVFVEEDVPAPFSPVEIKKIDETLIDWWMRVRLQSTFTISERHTDAKALWMKQTEKEKKKENE